MSLGIHATWKRAPAMGRPGAALTGLRLLPLLLLCAGPLAPGAAAQERVAVLEFRDHAGLGKGDLDYLTDVVARGAVRDGLPTDRYFVMTRESLETILEDKGIRLQDVCEGSCEVDVGRKIGAHHIVTGSVWKRRGGLEISVKLFETRSGKLRSQKGVSGPDVDAVRDPLRKALRAMVSDLAALAAAPPVEGSGPVFAPVAGVPAGPAEVRVTELKPTSAPAAAGGPAGLYITTEPPGAEVYLGAVRAGTAAPAFQKTDLQPGTRLRVTLRLADHHDKAFDVELMPGVTRYEGVKLDPAFGTLVIDSRPPGARVEIGGVEAGRTPYRNERMRSGQHLVSVDLDLHRGVSNEVVEVRDGETTRKTYTLEADYGTLAVDSEPRGARVLVGGRDVGTTPAEVRLKPGEYEVGLELAGYRGRGYRVSVVRGKKAEIPAATARLEREAFSVTVFADPPEPGARIFLDGKDTGKSAPETLTGVPAGKRMVEVRTDKKAGKAEVTGAHGEARSVTVALKGETPRPSPGKAPPAESAGTTAVKGKLGIEMVRIPAGSFTMGSPSNEPGRDDDEGPQHRVTLSRGFWLGKYEVTVGEFRRFVEGTGYKTEAEREGGAYTWTGSKWEKRSGVDWRRPGFGQSERDPVTCVSWNDVVRYCNWASEQEGLRPAYRISGESVTWDRGANGCRLPTEAEWEYAVRAGTETPFAFGRCLSTEEANYDGNNPLSGCPKGQYREKTIPVGSLRANAWGLYDMHGKVWEWCWDWYGAYSSGAVTDPTGSSSGSGRVRRGGSWDINAHYCRSANRGGSTPDLRGSRLGFRLCRSGVE